MAWHGPPPPRSPRRRRKALPSAMTADHGMVPSPDRLRRVGATKSESAHTTPWPPIASPPAGRHRGPRGPPRLGPRGRRRRLDFCGRGENPAPISAAAGSGPPSRRAGSLVRRPGRRAVPSARADRPGFCGRGKSRPGFCSRRKSRPGFCSRRKSRPGFRGRGKSRPGFRPAGPRAAGPDPGGAGAAGPRRQPRQGLLEGRGKRGRGGGGVGGGVRVKWRVAVQTGQTGGNGQKYSRGGAGQSPLGRARRLRGHARARANRSKRSNWSKRSNL